MKKQFFLLALTLMAISFSTMAQTLNIHLNDGTVNNYPISVIQKFTVSGTDMNLVKTDGSTLTFAISDIRKYTYTITVDIDTPNQEAEADVLVYPNPAVTQFNLNYTLPKAQEVNVSLYEMNGKLIQTVVSEKQAEGEHSIKMNNPSLKAGVYLIKLQTENKLSVKKIIITK